MIDYKVNFRNKKTGELVNQVNISIPEYKFGKTSIALIALSEIKRQGGTIPKFKKVRVSYSII